MAPFRLPDDTRLGRVRLRVIDLDRAVAFYRDLLGCAVTAQEPGKAVLASPGGAETLVVLVGGGAVPRPPRTTGLYHLAILLPDRAALARACLQLARNRWPFQGFSDHAVSEAAYLADPDGNGIELYRDRPREAWPRVGDEIRMTTRALDPRDLFREAEPDPGTWQGLHPGARIGHVHLHVGDLDAAEAFYHGILGFDVVLRSYPGALFLSAGGYHHHIGLNVWAGQGAPPPPPDAVGLLDFEIRVPPAPARAALLRRLREAGVEPAPEGRAWRFHDPDGNGILLSD